MQRFSGRRILVLGDVILDRYIWGEATRLSPEAPVPVVRQLRSSSRPGGAGNTAANLAALGAKVDLVGVTGADAESLELASALKECGISSELLVEDVSRPTTTKTRVIAFNHQVVRVDHEDVKPLGEQAGLLAMERITEALRRADAVVVSDYAKGFAGISLLSEVITWSRRTGKTVFIDPKGADFSRYAGCTLLKPNRIELGILTGMRVQTHEETLAAGAMLASRMVDTRVLVTEGADGMTLFYEKQPPVHVACPPRQVFDVTGAGDTVLAVVALGVCSGASYVQAMQLATEAALIAVSRMGTAVVGTAALDAAVGEEDRTGTLTASQS
jgi:D-beta-D-heptose 7-phosphate kinase/D-beta-D-heptose 1-phosphate adenosyltransferase